MTESVLKSSHRHELIIGNCLDVLKTLPSESVDLTISSPPYLGLRDYRIPSFDCSIHNKGCVIGLENNINEFIDHLVAVFSEVKRVLKKSGSFYLNLGDCYAGHKGYDGSKIYGGKEHGEIKDHYRAKGQLPDKCLMGMPWRTALALVDDGWILRNDIIWHKPNSMPYSGVDRLTSTYEHIFHFVKSNKTILWHNILTDEWVNVKPEKKYVENNKIFDDYRWWCLTCKKDGIIYRERLQHQKMFVSHKIIGRSLLWVGFTNYFNLDAIRVPHKSNDSENNKSVKTKYLPLIAEDDVPINNVSNDVNLLKQDNVPSKNANMYAGFNDRWKYRTNESNPYNNLKDRMAFKRKIEGKDHDGCLNHVNGKNPGDVIDFSNENNINPGDFWDVVTASYHDAHFAVYPEEICVNPIKSSCPLDGVVLGPFSGSGTTAKVAQSLGRNSISIDINPCYAELWRKRLRANEGLNVEYVVRSVP